jgi:hypothetical protein
MASPSVPSASAAGRTARVRFRHPSTVDGLLDAGWWPRSRDLAGELPPLLDVIWAGGGNVMNISYALGFWDPIPRRLNVDGRLVQLTGFHTQLACLLSLTGRAGHGRIDVLVIPPDTDPAVANRALAIVSDQPSPAHPSQVLDRARLEIAG